MNKAPRKNTIVTLGRSQYRIIGSERQDDTFIVRAVRLNGRGRIGAEITFDVRELGKSA